jgi:hypothetical protein
MILRASSAAPFLLAYAKNLLPSFNYYLLTEPACTLEADSRAQIDLPELILETLRLLERRGGEVASFLTFWLID